MNTIRKAFKIIGITLLGLILLPLLLIGLLYIPPVQNWAVHTACDYASEATGMQITLQRVRLTPLLDLQLENLTVVQQDTLLHTDEVVVDLDFSEVFDSKVGVESISILGGLLDSHDLVPQMHIAGRLDLLQVGREDTDLKAGIARLSHARIEGCDLGISLRDTTIVDTTTSSEPLAWSIAIGEIGIENTRIHFSTAGDTMSVCTEIRSASLKRGDINLGTSVYQIGNLGLAIDSLLLCMKDTAGAVTSIPLPTTTLTLDSLLMDTAMVSLEHFALSTGEADSLRSTINGTASIDFSALTPCGDGQFHIDANASLSHQDLLYIAQDFLPTDLAAVYPALPLQARLNLGGNIDALDITQLDIALPTALEAKAEGHIVNIMDAERREGAMSLDARTMNLDFVRRYLALGDILLPSMALQADAKFKGNAYEALATLQRGEGKVLLEAKADLDHMAYDANLAVRELNIADFMPKDSIGRLSLTAEMRGHGTNPYSRATRLLGRVSLDKLEYKQWLVDNANLSLMLKERRASMDLLCDNELLEANACANLTLDEQNSLADFSLAMNKINFYALGLTQDTLSASMTLAMEGSTDLLYNHRLRGTLHSMELTSSDSTYYPLDIDLEAQTNDSIIYAQASSGDLALTFNAQEGIESMMAKVDQVMQEVTTQVDHRRIAPDTIRGLLPRTDMHISCGKVNPVANILRYLTGATFNNFAFDLATSPEVGINGQGHLNKVLTSAVCIDSISWRIDQEHDNLDMLARVKNGPRNRVVNFESILTASISPNNLKTHLLFLDDKRRKGIDLGMMAKSTDTATWVSLFPHQPILAYRTFSVNDSNYVAIDSVMRIKADMHLMADDGTSLSLYSTPNPSAQQDVTFSIGRFNLGELSAVIPFMPMITGMLSGDIHAVQEGNQYTFSADMKAEKMAYEGNPLGDLGMNLIYFPNADGTHLVDGIMTQNEREVAQLSGMYQALEDDALIEAEAIVTKLPLNMANGFIPDNIMRLEGWADGLLRIKGSTSNPIVTGGLATDSMHICSDPYSIDLRIPDDTIKIVRNQLYLNSIQAYAKGNNPLTMDGTVDFRDLDKVMLNINIITKDFNLINAPKRKGAEAYGKVYTDFFGRLSGTLDNLDIRGRLKINGKTNVTYVMKDSPLVVEDQLSSLVTFTDFSDTIPVAPMQMPEQNVNMDLQVSIDEATTIHCLMDENGEDKIDLEGGGDLRMTYDMINGMRLYGRYTILSGRMDYSLVVVSLKNFQIHSGSYVEFTGDMFNPKLNLSASERKKASVTNNNVTQTVNFDVGLKITQSLSDLGLEFTLEAPDNITVRNELTAMSPEERGRASVAMLTTGMYLSPNGGAGAGGFDANSALNSFLNSQITNIAGKALSTVDIGFGIDNTTNATGAQQTDYNFSFAKRFWGNRISIIIGGKVSSGNEVKNTGMSIINNVAIEYRLDNSGTRYVKAFYNKDTESLLDADVMEMGGALVLRKKTENLGELFIFRNTKKKKK